MLIWSCILPSRDIRCRPRWLEYIYIYVYSVILLMIDRDHCIKLVNVTHVLSMLALSFSGVALAARAGDIQST